MPRRCLEVSYKYVEVRCRSTMSKILNIIKERWKIDSMTCVGVQTLGNMQ